MAGLFTLDSQALGVLDTNVLGGFGTGFVTASNSLSGTITGQRGQDGAGAGANVSTGSCLGVVGFAGAVAGSVVTVGTSVGAVAFMGVVTGLSTSSGSVSGAEGDLGVVAGSSTTVGTVVGGVDIFAEVLGTTTLAGVAAGTPGLTGSAPGSSASAGSVSGSPDVPPVPPPAPALDGGGRLFIPDYLRLPTPTHEGSVRGRSLCKGSNVGRAGRVGVLSGAVVSTGLCTGVRWPSDGLVRKWRRQHEETEFVALELL